MWSRERSVRVGAAGWAAGEGARRRASVRRKRNRPRGSRCASLLAWAPWRPRRPHLRRQRWILAGSPLRKRESWKTARSAMMTTTVLGRAAAAAPSPAAAWRATGPTRGAGRLPVSAAASPSRPLGAFRGRGTSPRPRWATCTATAVTVPRTRSAPTRRLCPRRGCRRARTRRRVPGSPSGSAATTPWTDSASEAGPTEEDGAGVGAGAAARGVATRREGRPEGEAALASAAARAGGSPRLGNVSFLQEGGGGPSCRVGPLCQRRATWPRARGGTRFLWLQLLWLCLPPPGAADSRVPAGTALQPARPDQV